MKPRFLILLACLSVLVAVPFLQGADSASTMPVYGTFKAPMTSTAASPAFQFNGDTGVGIYRSGTDELRMCTAGSDRLTILLDGKIGIGTTIPGYKLDVSGDANLSSGSVLRINGTSVLSGSALGSGVTSSSLTSVGTLGSMTTTGAVKAGDGTAGAPSYSFGSSGNDDNGMYLSAANQLGFSTAGAERVTVKSDG